MPPKKKTKAAVQQQVNTQKQSQQEPKKEEPKAKVEEVKKQVKKEEPKVQTKPLQQISPQETVPQKILLQSNANKSEQQLIELRKLRFGGTIGTDTTGPEAQKLQKERIQKFGGVLPQTKEMVQKRKEKFGGGQQKDDLETLKKRLEKYGSKGVMAVTEDKSVMDERRKKFGNPEAEVSLESEIQKSKLINKKDKFHGQKTNQKFKMPIHPKYRR